MKWFILLIILVPALEIGILISAGNVIGVLPTVLLIILTAIAGGYLAKSQGLQAIRRVQNMTVYDNGPGDTVIDGLCILIGGILLLAPGFITDITGFFLLIPATRKLLKPLIYKWIQRKMRNGNVIIHRP